MPYFLLNFGDASRPPVAAIIIEAPSMFQARMTAVVRRLAFGVPFGEGLNLSAEMMTSTGSRRSDPSARPKSQKARAMTASATGNRRMRRSSRAVESRSPAPRM